MQKKLYIIGFIAALSAVPSTSRAQTKLNVMTATEDLAAIAREVGGDKVAVDSIARGYQDPHFVEAKPSFILKLQKADLLVVVGRELEIGWLPPLITQSRNGKIQVGGPGYLDASLQAQILDIPTGTITRAMGDVHPQGNPHYWLDPANGRRIAQTIKEKLSQLPPGDRAYFEQRYADADERRGGGAEFTDQPESIRVVNDRTEQGLHQVGGEAHPARRIKDHERFFPALPLEQGNEPAHIEQRQCRVPDVHHGKATGNLDLRGLFDL